MQIYLARNNQQAGPYSLDDFNQMLAEQKVLMTDLIWHKGMREWKTIGEVTQGQIQYQPDTLYKTAADTTQNNQTTAKKEQSVTRLASIPQRVCAKIIDLLLWIPTIIIPHALLSNDGYTQLTQLQQQFMQYVKADQLEQANQLSTQALQLFPQTAWLFVGIYIVLMLTLQAYLLTKNGQSIGKKVMGIQIIGVDTSAGLNRTFILRSLFFIIITLFIFPFASIIDSLFALGKKRQSIHDLLSKTIVIEKKK